MRTVRIVLLAEGPAGSSRKRSIKRNLRLPWEVIWAEEIAFILLSGNALAPTFSTFTFIIGPFISRGTTGVTFIFILKGRGIGVDRIEGVSGIGGGVCDDCCGVCGVWRVGGIVGVGGVMGIGGGVDGIGGPGGAIGAIDVRGIGSGSGAVEGI